MHMKVWPENLERADHVGDQTADERITKNTGCRFDSAGPGQKIIVDSCDHSTKHLGSKGISGPATRQFLKREPPSSYCEYAAVRVTIMTRQRHTYFTTVTTLVKKEQPL